jgi:hypothetical protein
MFIGRCTAKLPSSRPCLRTALKPICFCMRSPLYSGNDSHTSHRQAPTQRHLQRPLKTRVDLAYCYRECSSLEAKALPICVYNIRVSVCTCLVTCVGILNSKDMYKYIEASRQILKNLGRDRGVMAGAVGLVRPGLVSNRDPSRSLGREPFPKPTYSFPRVPTAVERNRERRCCSLLSIIRKGRSH